MLCPSVIFSNFTQSLKDRWDLLFTEASLCYLFHKPKKKNTTSNQHPKNNSPPKKALAIGSYWRRKWILLCLNKQQCSLEEVQEPPVHTWRCAHATTGSGLRLYFLITGDSLTSVSFWTAFFYSWILFCTTSRGRQDLRK